MSPETTNTFSGLATGVAVKYVFMTTYSGPNTWTTLLNLEEILLFYQLLVDWLNKVFRPFS